MPRRDPNFGEAIRLGRVLVGLLEPEALGLLALMLLHESRRAARTASDGDLILLEDQDRARWNREHPPTALALVEQALASRWFVHAPGGIAASHAPKRPAPCDGLGADKSSASTTC